MSQTILISSIAATSTTASFAELSEEEKCLTERRWWCFLLSSIFTFLAGLLIVLLWRAFAFLCCRKEPELAPNDPKQKEQKANRQGKQEFEGTFMTEAKDWAGELISGQTTTGRILVCVTLTFSVFFSRYFSSLVHFVNSTKLTWTVCFRLSTNMNLNIFLNNTKSICSKSSSPTTYK